MRICYLGWRLSSVLLALIILFSTALPGVSQSRKSRRLADPQSHADKAQESRIQQRDQNSIDIFVDQPKVYDDASLQIMLNSARSRLASLQVLDQSGLLSKIGA